MIEDDIDLSRRAAVERERGYRAGRRRERGFLNWRRDREADELEAEAFGGGLGGGLGLGMGGGGGVLVVIGLVLMAIAYFGLGLVGPDPYAAYGDGSGFSPAVDRFSDGYSAGSGEAYAPGGYDLMTQRPMMFMGGGFLMLAGFILAAAANLRTFVTGDRVR